MMDIFAVTGKPVSHSLSPDVFHRAFLEEGRDAVYTRLAAASAVEALEMARRLGLRGLNVTSPFKEEMVDLVDHLDAEALKIGAVNGVVFSSGRTFGFNTDGLGVLGALKMNGVELNGKKAAVLGAGGAARAAVCALTEAGVEVVILNRTFSRAADLARKFGCRASPFSRLAETLRSADLIVSAVSTNDLPFRAEWLGAGQVILEANYRDPQLSLIARKKGCLVIGGIDWLVAQAAAAFEIFTGRTITPHELKNALLPEPAPRETPSVISLIGMMGSGKTSIGRRLASELGFSFIDTDEVIEIESKMRIPEIFKTRGEASFRELERKTIAELLQKCEKTVLALGGGAAGHARTRKKLRRRSFVIWLWADADLIMKRIPASGRPLLGGGDPGTRLRTLLADRLGDYARAADLIVNANHPPEVVTRKIIDEIR